MYEREEGWGLGHESELLDYIELECEIINEKDIRHFPTTRYTLSSEL